MIAFEIFETKIRESKGDFQTMNDFTFYFGYGWEHIISISALDHILFIVALAALHSLKNWKQVIILITAFTIGHSLTLALSVYDVFRFESEWVEFLIPVTIVITALYNLMVKDMINRKLITTYLLALIFGLIHGMGFANTIRFTLASDQDILVPLLGFNLGLEAGQIILMFLILGMHYIVVERTGLSRTWWNRILSVIALCIALYMAISRWPL